MPPKTASSPQRKHQPSIAHRTVVAELKEKRKEGQKIIKEAEKKQRSVDRAHKKLMKKASALEVHELALILGMKAQAFVEADDFDASSSELSVVEKVAQSILELGKEKRDAASGH